MSVGQVGAPSFVGQDAGRKPSGGGSFDLASLTDGSSMDQISVDLPNGFKVSATHIGVGNSAFNAQLLSSLEDIVDHLSGIAPSGNDGFTPPPGVPRTGTQEYRTLDTFHVDLPNGYSVELSHATLPGGGDNDAAAMLAMAEAVEQLVARFGAYSGLPPSPHKA